MQEKRENGCQQGETSHRRLEFAAERYTHSENRSKACRLVERVAQTLKCAD